MAQDKDRVDREEDRVVVRAAPVVRDQDRVDQDKDHLKVFRSSNTSRG